VGVYILEAYVRDLVHEMERKPFLIP